MHYECLQQDCYDNNIYVVEKAFKSSAKGLIKGNKIAIRKDVPTLKEKACILAEEIGHYHTTAGNILDQSIVSNRKQELKARLWGYNRLVGLNGIINCYKHGCTNVYEMAEYLEVTEQFLNNAIECYKNKYGLCKKIDNFIIYFEPGLAVFELFGGKI